MVSTIGRELYLLHFHSLFIRCVTSYSIATLQIEVICHGIPDYREVQDGDIVNIDVTTYSRGGYHGDLNETFFVGNVDADGRRVVETAFECLQSALAMVKPG